jgi:hypothetical protein
MDDRGRLIAYLLHEMPEDERDAFAERWFVDPAMHEELRMTEAELLDNYARGSVSRSRRQRIERYLLDSEPQRRKLAFAAGLHAALPVERHSYPAWITWSVAAALALVAGLSIWLAVQNRNLRQELESARLRTPSISADGVFAVFLPGGTLRGSSPLTVVRVPAGVSMVRFDLELDGADAADRYTAALSTAGQIVWTEEAPIPVEPRGRQPLVPVWIPANLLNPANHTLVLKVRGEPIGYYSFTVERRPN